MLQLDASSDSKQRSSPGGLAARFLPAFEVHIRQEKFKRKPVAKKSSMTERIWVRSTSLLHSSDTNWRKWRKPGETITNFTLLRRKIIELCTKSLNVRHCMSWGLKRGWTILEGAGYSPKKIRRKRGPLMMEKKCNELYCLQGEDDIYSWHNAERNR